MKGSMSVMIGLIVAVVFSLMIMVTAGNTAEALDSFIKKETVDLASERMETSIYMMSGLKQARLTVNYRDEYGIVEDSGSVYLNYTMDDVALGMINQDDRHEINPPNNFEYDQVVSESFCLEKKPGSNVKVEAGECG